MKTTKYILLTAVGMLLIGGSCSETYDIYPEEYSKVVRLKSSGAQEITVYSPHAVTVCPVTVQKGGWNPETDATATLRIMTEAEFNDYLLESGAGYSYIPSSCYSFSDGTGATQTTVSFNGDVRYQTVNLNLYPPKIGEFLETYTDASRTPVIPVILESQDAGIDMESRELFIMPNYAEPSVGFQNGGLQVLPDGTDSYQLKIGFPFTSEWDVNCKIEVDPSALDAYNKANGTSYGLMPEGSYSGVGDVKIANGEEYATLDIKLDLVKALFRNALPLRITSIDADGFTISETPAVIAIDNAAGYKINLTADDISSMMCMRMTVPASPVLWMAILTPIVMATIGHGIFPSLLAHGYRSSFRKRHLRWRWISITAGRTTTDISSVFSLWQVIRRPANGKYSPIAMPTKMC